VDVVLVNSHDGRNPWEILTGIFRLICSNGQIAGDFEATKLRHINATPADFIEASRQVADRAPQVAQALETWQTIELTQDEQGVYAQAAHQLLGEDHPMDPDYLLTPRRHVDGSPDLWTVHNRVQENLIRGGLPYQMESGRRQRTRAVRSVDRNLALNRALWKLTSEMARLKAA